MSIYNAIANAGSDAGAGLNAFAKGRYMVQQQEQQNALAQGERDYARSRNALADQRQVTQEQMAFGQQTLKILSALPPEQRQRAFLARVQEAEQTIGLPQNYDPAQAWASVESQLPPTVATDEAAPSNVREWEYFKGLSKEDQQRYLTMKRASQIVGMGGGGQGVLNTVDGGITTVVTPEDATGRDAERAGAITGAQQGAQTAEVVPRAVAENQAAAVTGLSAARQKVDETRAIIEKLRNHPGRQRATGRSSMVPLLAGSPGYDFEVLRKQAEGGVFLEAYEMLKGGGPITNIEGQKAEQAKARMDSAQSEGAFLEALNDYEEAIITGLERLERSAAGPSGPAPSAPARVVLRGHPTLGDITEEDIQRTMRESELTRQQVMEILQRGR